MKEAKSHRVTTLAACCAAAILGCLALVPVAQAATRPAIVGLWAVTYVSTTGGPTVLTFDQWHSDGQEFETANLFVGAACQGTYKVAANGSVHLYHVAWTFDASGAYSGYWDEHLTANVAADGKTYSGTYAKDFYDTNNNFLFEDDGTFTATRLTVQN